MELLLSNSIYAHIVEENQSLRIIADRIALFVELVYVMTVGNLSNYMTSYLAMISGFVKNIIIMYIMYSST